MSAHSYVACMVCRTTVPREAALCLDTATRFPYRRRHVCGDCIRAMSLAFNQDARAAKIAAWRAAVRSAASGATNGAGRA